MKLFVTSRFTVTLIVVCMVTSVGNSSVCDVDVVVVGSVLVVVELGLVWVSVVVMGLELVWVSVVGVVEMG